MATTPVRPQPRGTHGTGRAQTPGAGHGRSGTDRAADGPEAEDRANRRTRAHTGPHGADGGGQVTGAGGRDLALLVRSNRLDQAPDAAAWVVQLMCPVTHVALTVRLGTNNGRAMACLELT